MGKKAVLGVLYVILLCTLLNCVLSVTYVVDLGLILEKPTYSVNETIDFSGNIKQANITSGNASAFVNVVNATINISVVNSTEVNQTSVSSGLLVNSSSSGVFNGSINASSLTGDYYVRAIYTDSANKVWYTFAPIKVLSVVVDEINVRTKKARYYSNESMEIVIETTKEVGDNEIGVANVSINGTMRYSNKTNVSDTNFSCTTASDGSCSVTSLNAPPTEGSYIIEVNDFGSSKMFRVVPFDVGMYVKDSTGEDFREILSSNERGSIEVSVSYNGSTVTSGVYYFNGTIKNSAGNIIKNITTNALNNNNSYKNSYGFTVDNTFGNGIYTVDVTVFQEGGNSINVTKTFQVRDWVLSVNKAAKNSGFEYGFSSFNSQSLNLEAYPVWRVNGSIINNVNLSTGFNITIKNKYGNTLDTGDVIWNATCSEDGCYQINLTSPSVVDSYDLAIAVNFSDEVLTERMILNVIDLSVSVTPTNQEGELKEVFGTNEFVYLTIGADNISGNVNISSANITKITYENGTEVTYTENGGWAAMNLSDSTKEWSWNQTLARIKMDSPKVGGVYNLKLSINNNSAATTARFIISPYDVCSSPKTTAGSVSGSNYYVWQYKTSDTVYFELKIKEASNPTGKFTGDNFTSTYDSSYYGMGGGCHFNTAKNRAVTNATVTIEEVLNTDSGMTFALNTSTSLCKADDNSGTYTCTLDPLSDNWDGGRYRAKLKIIGGDNETMDIGYGTFEARAFYLWAWTSDWRNKPTSNISLQIQMYQPGTSWWSNYGNSGGLSGTVSVEKVQYNGNIGEWIWPPIEYDYNTTNLNSSIISGGNGNLTLPVSRSPDGVWKSGSYSVVLRGTDSDSGESDYGQAWFEIRQWDAYASPVTTYGSGYQYKSSFNSKDNISLYVKISEAGDYSGNSGTDLGGNVTISIKKIQDYSSWPPKEINSSSYIATSIVVDESSPWYSSATHASHSGYIINLTPVDGTWDTGYYNVVLDINDTESGWGYFNAIAFYANAEPSDADGDYLYTTNGTGPVFFNVTTTKSQKYYYSSYTNADYIDTTVRDSILRTWSARSYEQIEYNYPEDFNITPLSVNGSTILNFTKNNGNWDSGYYSGEITLEDNESQTANAYLWFNVQLFRVDASSASSTIGTTSNLTVNLSIYNPDWSSNTLLDGNYTVTEVVENNWGYYGNNPTFHTDYSPSASDYFNQETVLRVEAPSGGWTGGWKSATVTVYDNDNEVTQEGWISFEVALFDITVNSVTNQDSITANSNVTVNVSLTNPDDSSDSIGNLSQLYDWDCQYYCIQQYYNFTVGNCKSWIDGSCMINGTQNVNVVVPSGGWSDGYHYLTAVYTETTNADSSKENWDIWFKIAKAYDGWFSNEDEDGNWQYYVGFGDNATFKMYLYNGSQSWPYTYDVDVIVTSVEYSEDGDDCWDDYCRDWTEANWTVVGGNANNTLNGTTGYLTIINPGEWERGYHTVRMNITGDRGSSTIQTGYFYVKDLTGPNITIHSPEENSTITDDFWFNATTSENSTCYLYLLNYGNYDSWYCWNNNTGLCDSTQWTGDTYFYKYISEYVEYDWGYTYGDEDFVTGNHNHRYLFDVSSLSLSDQDYVVYAYCYDVDWNYISKSVPFTYNST